MSMYRPSPQPHHESGSSSTHKKRTKSRVRNAVRNAAWYACEKLEGRRLLASGSELTGGGIIDGVPQEKTYTYLDANENTIKIALWGSITAEFLFVKVNYQNDNTSVTGAVAPTPQNITDDAGEDLFAIYVASAKPSASISIGQETNTTTGLMGGFTSSSANAITVTPATVSATATNDTIVVTPTPANSGAVYLGARAYIFKPDTTPEPGPPVDGKPITSVTLSSTVGVRPVTADDTLYAGIMTAPGVSLNRIFIGGQVTGRVDIGGSINTFYAGEIWTGDADGISVGSTPTGALARNFNVGGDLYNLITLGSIGTDAGTSTDGVTLSGNPAYETGFRLSVGGHIGQIKSESSTGTGVEGSIYAENLSTFKGLGLAQTEVETTGPTPLALSGESFFEGNAPTSSSATDNEPGLNEAAAVAAGDTTAEFDNNSAASAQFLGTPLSATLGHNAIQLTGVLDESTGVGDDLDFYGVALGADQTISATLSSPEDQGELQLGIFAPDEGYSAAPSATALLASTYDSINNARTADQPLTFTTTDAGIYYFAIGEAGDGNFNRVNSNALLGAFNYELDVTGVKNLGIGAVAAVDGLNFPSGGTPSVRVDYGDLGAIVSTGTATNTAGTIANSALGAITAGDGSYSAEPITAKTGSIRVIQAGTIGSSSSLGGVGDAPDIYAAGNVGVIRTTVVDTGTPANGGIMAFNIDVDAVGDGTPIGGSYQLIDCAGLFYASLVADGNIGTLDANDIGLTNGYAPVLQVDANSKSDDGTIDLIDVTGSHFGTLGEGGPQIATGPGGNVRYIHVSPDATVYNDNFFGGQTDNPIVYGAGKAATLIDDSGTPFTVTPYRGQTLSGDAAEPTSTSTSTSTSTGSTTADDTTTITGDSLSILTYGIEDKGGVVVISLTATAGDVDVAAATTSTSTTSTATVTTDDYYGPDSISVDTSAKGTNGSVDFGEISMVGLGSTLTFDPTTRAFTEGATTPSLVPEDDSATFSGKSPINVYDLTATTPDVATGVSTGALAGMTNVENKTSGEIVGFHANDVETLDAASLGFAKSDTGAPVSGATVLVNAYPFHEQRNLIQIGGTLIGDGDTGDPTVSGDLEGTYGNAETIESSGPLGNILSDGTIGSVLADVGAGAAKGYQEGIIAPVYAATPGEFSSKVTPIDVWGNILNVNVGQGLGASGTGNYATTGIFADNYIGNVVNQNGSDIRGDVVTEGDAGGLPTVVNISPITGDPIPTKGVAGTYINSIDLSDGGSLIGATVLTTTAITDAIASIVTGHVVIETPNTVTNSNPADARYAVGTISLTGDGGIIGSTLIAGGFNTISVAGFGILTSNFSSLNGDVINSITAAGYGIRTTTFIGQNTIGTIDVSGTGKELPVTDYSASVRQSESGATVDAYSGKPLDEYDDLDQALAVTRKVPTRKGSTEAGVIDQSTFNGSYQLGSVTAWRLENTLLDFANNIGKILVGENTESDNITTGSLNTFSSGHNVVGTEFSIAGEIKSLTAGFLNGSTYINDSGPDGSIDYLATTAGLNANIDASVSIGEILVGTDLASTSITTGGNLDELYVKHSILSGANITVARQLETLVIRHNLLGGSTIQARSIGKKTIGGVTNGNIIIVPTTP